MTRAEGNGGGLRLDGLTKRFGVLTAVRELSLAIHPGEVYGLIGPNGSGKTTTVKMLTGLWPDFRGRSAETLATSAGGLLTSALCLGYVAACGWFGYRLVLALLTGAPPSRLAGPLAAVTLVSAAVAAGPLWLARHRRPGFEVR